MLSKVEAIHEFTGLREFADLPLKYYSSGMYMRLAFAVATEIDPEILIIDEALGVGDAAFQEQGQASHVQAAWPLARRDSGLPRHENFARDVYAGLWLKQGRIQADGPIEPIVDQYLAKTETADVG